MPFQTIVIHSDGTVSRYDGDGRRTEPGRNPPREGRSENRPDHYPPRHGGHKGGSHTQRPPRNNGNSGTRSNSRGYCIGSIVTNNGISRPSTARKKLEDVVRLFQPIMQEHNLYVEQIMEIDPEDEGRLHGANSGQGNKIVLSLKTAPWHMVLDTMLHELSHNRHGPHDRHFYLFWNELRETFNRHHGGGWQGPENDPGKIDAHGRPTRFRHIKCGRGNDVGVERPARSSAPLQILPVATLHERCARCNRRRSHCRCADSHF